MTIEQKKTIHERAIVHKFGFADKKTCEENNITIEKQLGKHRYFMFIGSKTDKKILKASFLLPVLPYPKGDNKRYSV